MLLTLSAISPRMRFWNGTLIISTSVTAFTGSKLLPSFIFNKHIWELELHQFALLAGLIREPGKLLAF